MSDMFTPQPPQPGPGPAPIPGTPLAGPPGPPPAGPPQHAAPAPGPAPAAVQWDTSYPAAGHELLARHHNVHGGLDILLRRLGEVLGAHAAVISRIIEGATPQPGGPVASPFWERIVEAMKANQGSLRVIEQGAEQLLTDHAGVIGAVERFL